VTWGGAAPAKKWSATGNERALVIGIALIPCRKNFIAG